MSTECSGYALFCDDIRFELGGKMTLVGRYNQSMMIAAPFPVVLPKLGILIRYAEGSEVEQSDLAFRVFVPGQNVPVFEHMLPVPEQRIENGSPRDPFGDNSVTRMRTIEFPLIFAFLQIERPGNIKVRVYRDSEEIRIGVLQVHQVDDAGVILHYEPKLANEPVGG